MTKENDTNYARSWKDVVIFLIQSILILGIIYCLARCQAGPMWFGVDTQTHIERKL